MCVGNINSPSVSIIELIVSRRQLICTIHQLLNLLHFIYENATEFTILQYTPVALILLHMYVVVIYSVLLYSSYIIVDCVVVFVVVFLYYSKCTYIHFLF